MPLWNRGGGSTGLRSYACRGPLVWSMPLERKVANRSVADQFAAYVDLVAERYGAV